jgi:hypothetical protein
MRPGEPERAWGRIERLIEVYEAKISPVRWFGDLFRGREGFYVLLRMAFLLCALKTVFMVPVGWWTKLLTVASTLFLLDILLASTSVEIVTRSPARALRSIVLTFLSYLSIGVSFGVFYAGVRGDFGPTPLCGAWRALYFSFVTMTTLGYGDITPLPNCRTRSSLVMLELGLSVYFLVILIARVVAWQAELRN